MTALYLRLRSTLILLRHDRMPLGVAWRRAAEIWRKPMSEDYDNLIRRLLIACNLDPEVLPGLHEDAIVMAVQYKVTEGDKRIEAAQQQVDRWREAAEVERACCRKAEAELERLIEGCVRAVWRNSDYYDEGGDGFDWRFGNSSGFVYEKSDAIAAVRKAAGLEVPS